MTDLDFIYPREDFRTVVQQVRGCLTQSPGLAPLMIDSRFRLDTHLTRISQEYGVHPAWLLTTLQRERGLLCQAGRTDKDFARACGFVGSNAPGTTNTDWDGLANQLWRCARHSGWYAGFGPRQAYGVSSALWPTKKRLSDFGMFEKPWVYLESETLKYQTKSLAEYVQLMYTDHLAALEQNRQIHEAFVAPFFRV